MNPTDPNGPPGPSDRPGLPGTVVCATCDGITFTLDRCRCRDGDGAFLITDSAGQVGPDGRPWPDCETCSGDGTIVRPCRDCRQHGLRRAQLVLTVANLDTGAVASANIVPGVLEPDPAPGGGWRLALAPLLHELADRAGIAAATLREPGLPDQPVNPDGELSLYLPRDWHPDLPAAERHRLEALALATRCYAPWLVYHGTSTPPEPPDHDRLLDRLCLLADQLCLDLVIEARRDGYGGLRWDIRYETPGADLPGHPNGQHPDLPTAVARTTARNALNGLAQRSLTAPAHFVNPALPDPARLVREPADVDQLERRILRDLAESTAAQAIWRDQRWRHTGLRPGGTTTTYTTLDTGQIIRRRTTGHLRNWEPPPPAWQAEPIPQIRCPDCSGTGTRDWHQPCHSCAGSRYHRHGTVLTVTNLAGRTVHLNWRPDDQPPPPALVATQPAGQPVLQLTGRYQLRGWATVFGVPPEHLTDPDTGHTISQHLLDGIVTPHHYRADPHLTYLANASRGRPAARLLIAATPWDAPSLDQLTHIAHGLGFTLQITLTDHRDNLGDPRLTQGQSWHVELLHPNTPPTPPERPLHRSLPEAITYCLRYLGNALHLLIPDNPQQPIPTPHQPTPAHHDSPAHRTGTPHRAGPAGRADPAETLRQVAAQHPGQPVTARLDRHGYRISISD